MAHATYPPINTLKPVARDVWIVDGPEIGFAMPGLPLPELPFPTRMTVIRIDDDLFIHSPTPLTLGLRTEIETLGHPRWIIGPNRIHYWWIPDWTQAFVDADVYLAPRIREQAGSRIDFDGLALDHDSGYPWDGQIATLPLPGAFMTEVEFFHHASRTLVLTDCIENFEAHKFESWWMRAMARLGGVLDPNGSMPRDMRLSYKNKTQLRAAVETMIAWNPERIVLAHGRWYPHDGAAELRRAFAWLLD